MGASPGLPACLGVEGITRHRVLARVSCWSTGEGHHPTCSAAGRSGRRMRCQSGSEYRVRDPGHDSRIGDMDLDCLYQRGRPAPRPHASTPQTLDTRRGRTLGSSAATPSATRRPRLTFGDRRPCSDFLLHLGLIHQPWRDRWHRPESSHAGAQTRAQTQQPPRGTSRGYVQGACSAEAQRGSRAANRFPRHPRSS